jgi:hypothetical protein
MEELSRDPGSGVRVPGSGFRVRMGQRIRQANPSDPGSRIPHPDEILDTHNSLKSVQTPIEQRRT